MYGFLRRRVDEDWQPPPPDNGVIGDYTEEYLIRTYNWLMQFKVFPEAGGLNDQPKAWVLAMEKLMGMNNQVSQEYHVWKNAHGRS